MEKNYCIFDINTRKLLFTWMCVLLIVLVCVDLTNSDHLSGRSRNVGSSGQRRQTSSRISNQRAISRTNIQNLNRAARRQLLTRRCVPGQTCRSRVIGQRRTRPISRRRGQTSSRRRGGSLRFSPSSQRDSGVNLQAQFGGIQGQLRLGNRRNSQVNNNLIRQRSRSDTTRQNVIRQNIRSRTPNRRPASQGRRSDPEGRRSNSDGRRSEPERRRSDPGASLNALETISNILPRTIGNLLNSLRSRNRGPSIGLGMGMSLSGQGSGPSGRSSPPNIGLGIGMGFSGQGSISPERSIPRQVQSSNTNKAGPENVQQSMDAIRQSFIQSRSGMSPNPVSQNSIPQLPAPRTIQLPAPQPLVPPPLAQNQAPLTNAIPTDQVLLQAPALDRGQFLFDQNTGQFSQQGGTQPLLIDTNQQAGNALTDSVFTGSGNNVVPNSNSVINNLISQGIIRNSENTQGQLNSQTLPNNPMTIGINSGTSNNLIGLGVHPLLQNNAPNFNGMAGGQGQIVGLTSQTQSFGQGVNQQDLLAGQNQNTFQQNQNQGQSSWGTNQIAGFNNMATPLANLPNNQILNTNQIGMQNPIFASTGVQQNPSVPMVQSVQGQDTTFNSQTMLGQNIQGVQNQFQNANIQGQGSQVALDTQGMLGQNVQQNSFSNLNLPTNQGVPGQNTVFNSHALLGQNVQGIPNQIQNPNLQGQGQAAINTQALFDQNIQGAQTPIQNVNLQGQDQIWFNTQGTQNQIPDLNVQGVQTQFPVTNIQGGQGQLVNSNFQGTSGQVMLGMNQNQAQTQFMNNQQGINTNVQFQGQLEMQTPQITFPAQPTVIVGQGSVTAAMSGGQGQILGQSPVFGNGQVLGQSPVFGNGQVLGQSAVFGNSQGQNLNSNNGAINLNPATLLPNAQFAPVTTNAPPATTPKRIVIGINPSSKGIKIVPDGKGGVRVIHLRHAITATPWNETVNTTPLPPQPDVAPKPNTANIMDPELLRKFEATDRVNTTDIPEERGINGHSPDGPYFPPSGQAQVRVVQRNAETTTVATSAEVGVTTVPTLTEDELEELEEMGMTSSEVTTTTTTITTVPTTTTTTAAPTTTTTKKPVTDITLNKLTSVNGTSSPLDGAFTVVEQALSSGRVQHPPVPDIVNLKEHPIKMKDSVSGHSKAGGSFTVVNQALSSGKVHKPPEPGRINLKEHLLKVMKDSVSGKVGLELKIVSLPKRETKNSLVDLHPR